MVSRYRAVQPSDSMSQWKLEVVVTGQSGHASWGLMRHGGLNCPVALSCGSSRGEFKFRLEMEGWMARCKVKFILYWNYNGEEDAWFMYILEAGRLLLCFCSLWM